MAKDLTLYAAPVFFSLIGLEMAHSWKNGKKWYRFTDTLANLSLGIGSQVIGVFLSAIGVVAYHAVYSRFHVLELSERGIVVSLLAFLGVDLGYYCYHRASHRVNCLWATHVVHHQSEQYNLSVALRQSWFSGIFSWMFYIPLALLGVPASVFATHLSLNLILQFWIHTKAIATLGPLDGILNTPSHHRVHHGTNPKYIDKNYAGVLIIWDRLFGSFEPEREPVIYGSLERFRRLSPLAANITNWRGIARATRSARGLDRARIWFNEPGWTPKRPSPAPNSGSETLASEPVEDLGETYGYALFQFVVTLASSFYFVGNAARYSLAAQLAVSGLIVWQMVAWSHLLERRRGAVGRELLRLVTTALAAIGSPVFGFPVSPWESAVVAYLVLSSLWLCWVVTGGRPEMEIA